MLWQLPKSFTRGNISDLLVSFLNENIHFQWVNATAFTWLFLLRKKLFHLAMSESTMELYQVSMQKDYINVGIIGFCAPHILYKKLITFQIGIILL